MSFIALEKSRGYGCVAKGAPNVTYIESILKECIARARNSSHHAHACFGDTSIAMAWNGTASLGNISFQETQNFTPVNHFDL